jgi:hypothetical protein
LCRHEDGFPPDITLQSLQRFGNGEYAHLQLGGQFTPGENRAQRQLSAQNPLPNYEISSFSQAAPVDFHIFH